jgi:hypothetical protein
MNLPNVLFPSGFPNKTLYTPLLSSPPYVLHADPCHSFRFHQNNNVWCGAQIIKLHTIYFSPLPCYLVPLKPKYSHKYAILKHPQPTFLPIKQKQTWVSSGLHCVVYEVWLKYSRARNVGDELLATYPRTRYT